jgi:large subunit ribosomal protein L19
MSHPILKTIEQSYLKADRPLIYPGDTVRVNVLIKEGNKERIQAFEGVIIARRGGGLSETFAVRKVFQGIGVERTFFLHSPKIESIKILKRGRVRRAKLYYLRERVGKAARIREKTTGYAAPNKFGSILVANPSTASKKSK